MKKTLLGCAVTAALANVSNVSAGGLWLNEFGDLAGGRAAAGAAAGVDEAMTIAYNPASATRIQGNQLFAAAGAFIPDIKFDTQYSNPRHGFDNGDDAGVVTPAGGMAYVHNFEASKWSAGVYAGGLAGAGLDYGEKWVGRYQATEVTLEILAVAPTLAYRLTDKLSLGASLQVYYAKLNQKLAVPHPDPLKPDGRGSINGNDTNVGFTLGAMYEVDARTRFGIAYQSELEPEFGGDLKVKFNPVDDPGRDLQTASDTKLNMGQFVRASIMHDLSEQWGVHLTLGWDDWSVLDNIFVSVEHGSAGLPTKWRDTYHYAWGAEYRMDKYWTFTGGVSYDTNPVDAKNRSPELPVDRQVRYALGARYQLQENLSIGGYFNYADLGKARIEATNYGGKYKNNAAPQIVANLNWAF